LTLILTSVFAGAAAIPATTRPEIRRSLVLVDDQGHKSIYRVNVQVVNRDSLPLSVVYVPYDQVEWRWSRALQGEYGSSFMDIRGSASAGTGPWKEHIWEEVWLPSPDRVWAADCELGGLERGALLDLVFFAEVDETLDVVGKPLRIGIGTCGEESFQRSDQYWSATSELLLRRLSTDGTLQRYRYSGCAGTLFIHDIHSGSLEGTEEGWSLLAQGGDSMVLVRDGSVGGVEFAIRGDERVSATGLLRWNGRWEGASHGYAFGPGSAEYSELRSVTLLREAGWPSLLQGLSVALFLAALAVVVLRVQKRRKR
jgi:hypothetical protein